MNNLANNLKQLRKNRGLKQDEMQAYGFKRTQWSSYENGIAEPSINGLISIAKIFNLTETDLIHGNFENPKTITEYQKRKKAHSRNSEDDLRSEIAALRKQLEKFTHGR